MYCIYVLLGSETISPSISNRITAFIAQKPSCGSEVAGVVCSCQYLKEEACASQPLLGSGQPQGLSGAQQQARLS